jgi:hypothetical protein
LKHQTYDLIREISLKHNHFVCGLLEQRVGQGELGEVVAPTSMVCKYSLLFSLIYICAWPVSFKVVFIYMNLSILDRSF